MSEPSRELPKGYDFVRPIGAGGCGEVILAKQVALGRLVAIKRIHGYALATGDDALERFRREAKVLASIDHPSVVKVFDFQRAQGDATLVMEYVEGESLADRLARGPIPAADAIVVLRDVADALRAAAAQGVAHRDIKPGNVFLLANGHAKVGDFGLARIASDPTVFKTNTGEVSGTPAYFPPECGDASHEPDERSDAYSFAVMAYEMLVGQLPFTGENMMEIVAAHFAKPPPPPETIIAGFPPAASAALLAGLAKEPADRLLPWQVVDQLAAVPAASWPAVAAPAARVVAKSDPTVITRLPTPASDPPPAAPPPVSLGPATKGRPGGGRRVGIISAIAAVVVIIVLAVSGAFSGSGSGGGNGHLKVRHVTIAASPVTGACPKADYLFTATIVTNSQAGNVTLRWTRPDGSRSTPTTVAAKAGQSSVSAVLRYDVTGSSPFQGRASLAVTAPTHRTAKSEQVTYTC